MADFRTCQEGQTETTLTINMRPPQAVILDIDDTVYAYQPCHLAGLTASWNLACSFWDYWIQFGDFAKDYDRARKHLKERVGEQAAGHSRLLYFKSMIEQKHGRTDITTTLALRTAYWDAYLSLMVIDPGCVEFLDHLRKGEIRIAWLTNYTTERQLWKLRHLGLDATADFLITSEEAGADKPNPVGLDLALNRLQSIPECTWMIGDSIKNDIGVAKTRNVTSVWFNRDHGDCSDIVPDYSVATWFDLSELFLRLQG